MMNNNIRKTKKLKTHPPYKIVFVGFINFSLTVLLSKNISRASVVKSALMDRYITTMKRHNIPGRSDIVKSLCEIIDSKGFVCLYGDSGVGKTYIVRNTLRNYIDLQPEQIKGSSDFLERLRYSTCNILIDDNYMDATVWNDLSTLIKNGKRLSGGALVIVTRNIKNIDFCDCIHVPPLDPEIVREIGGRLDLYKNGNIRNCLLDSDARDIFVTPKSHVHTMLSSKDAPTDRYDDHGYMWSIIHENYHLAKTPHYVDIMENLSIADIYDTNIYKGNWDLLPYLIHHGITLPVAYIDGSIRESDIRPGSSWTKYNNFRMRRKRVNSILSRNKFNLDIDSLILIFKTLNFSDYNITLSDIDTINHLSFQNKLKPKNIQKVKDALKRDRT